MNSNLKTFNEKEGEKAASRELIVETIKLQLGRLGKSLTEVKDLGA
jgi:hypothetical protein